jgi:predicted metal-binding protein
MKPRLPDKSYSEHLHILRLATREACLAHFDPARVLSYCAGCPNFESRWSCPPFPDHSLDRLGNWSHAVVAARKVPLPFEEIPSTPEGANAWALDRFHASRAEFREILLKLEKAFPGSRALVAGHCVQCTACAREVGDPCRFPEAMRYSLEAVGFDVTSLTAGILGVSIHWPSQGLPEYYLTVGALLCGAGQAEPILRALDVQFSA